jgi:hypothetical protein
MPFFTKLTIVVIELCRTRSYQTDCIYLFNLQYRFVCSLVHFYDVVFALVGRLQLKIVEIQLYLYFKWDKSKLIRILANEYIPSAFRPPLSPKCIREFLHAVPCAQSAFWRCPYGWWNLRFRLRWTGIPPFRDKLNGKCGFCLWNETLIIYTTDWISRRVTYCIRL